MTHLAMWMPFARAAQMLEELLGVQVSEPTVRREAERAGCLYEARQTAQGQQPAQASAAMSSEQQVISIEGAYVPLVKGEWAEVRTVAIGEVNAKVTASGKRDVYTYQLSYFSRMTDAVKFGDLAEVEMRRRGVSQAKAVCAVTDGADWLQGFIDLHRLHRITELESIPTTLLNALVHSRSEHQGYHTIFLSMPFASRELYTAVNESLGRM